MSALTVMLTLIGVLLHRVMLSELRSEEFAGTECQSLRLSTQFRADIHDATRVDLPVDEGSHHEALRIRLSNGRDVTYAHVEHGLKRVEVGNDQPEWREDYMLGDAIEAYFQRLSAPQRLQLTITNPSIITSPAHDKIGAKVGVRVSVNLEACIGLNEAIGATSDAH